MEEILNGELFQLLRLVCYLRDSVKKGKALDFKLGQYENQLTFTSIPRKVIFRETNEVSYNVKDWCESLLKRELQSINLLICFGKNDIRFEGFANSSAQGIVTKYADGTQTIWIAQWEFDRAIDEWNIYYKEVKLSDDSSTQYIFDNCYLELEKCLLEITEFAYKIECDNFGNIFKEAHNYLANKDDLTRPEWADELLPEFNDEQLRLFLAASRADVFGGMGSWNDTPPCMAHEKKLDKEYDNLSRNLYNASRKAVMHVANNYL